MTLNVFLSNLKYILQLSLVKFSDSLTFLGGRAGTGRDGHTEYGQTILGKYYFRFYSL